MQPAEARVRDDATRSHRSRSARGRSLAEPKMCPVLVIIADVLGQKPLQMLIVVDCDHMVEQVPSAALDPTLRNPIAVKAY